MASDSAQAGPYEFSEEQNRVIGRLGTCMRALGIVSVVLGALACVVGLFSIRSGGFAALVQGALILAVGLLTRSAGTEFRGIVATQGNDIDHLMSALRSLLKIYQIQIALLVAAFVVILAVFVFVVGSRGG
jgi:hypothetical protein